MQATSINIPYYAPAEPPDNSDMARYLREELFKISTAITLLAGGYAPVTNVAPTKPRNGMVKLADGVNWNPGAGQGYYGYYGAAWHLLG